MTQYPADPADSPDPAVDPIDRAVRVLRRGGLVAFPTETVYGLGADADQPDAVRRIFAVKRRPVDHPLIIHLADIDDIDDWGRDITDQARALAAACWPGPLTLLVHAAARVSPLVTGGRSTVGLRVPSHPVARRLLAAFGGGIAAPSANRFGRVSPTTADHVRADLGTDVDLILDGGPSSIGVESTIVDCTADPPQILRPGGIDEATIRSALHRGRLSAPAGPSRASGMLSAHYAPRCRVVLTEHLDQAEGLVAVHSAAGARRVEVLAPAGSSELYARHLYQWLREADERHVDVLIAVLPPAGGIGDAVRDRLTKAAAAG